MCMSLFTPGLHDGNLYIDLATCLWLNKNLPGLQGKEDL